MISRQGSGIYYDVERIALHPEFNINTLGNDIAVIELSDSITFVPGIIEAAELSGMVLRGGTALTMKNGMEVSKYLF